jgi:hypothetical protein
MWTAGRSFEVLYPDSGPVIEGTAGHGSFVTEQGELPLGVHLADWEEFRARFCGSSPRRLWLSGRLRTLLELASANGKLRRVFIWGSFVTAKFAPKDLDILLGEQRDREGANARRHAQKQHAL